MKTFLYSIPNKIQAFSKKLDVKAALCGNSWEVFNDEGVKQLFIFNEDETILITNNGKVLTASWKYIPQNSSILIKTDDETTMFRPAFFNNNVFALQQDGIERYLLLIDEEKKALFPNLTLDTLAAYIDKEIALSSLDKEEKRRLLQIEKQQEKERQRQIEKQREEEQRREKIEEEKRREEEEQKKQEEEKKQEEMEEQKNKEQERQALLSYIKEHKEEIGKTLAQKKKIGAIGIIVCLLLTIAVCFIPIEELRAMSLALMIIATLVFVGFYLASPIDVIRPRIGGVFYHNDKDVSKMYEEL